jgi:hypothetical protein
VKSLLIDIPLFFSLFPISLFHCPQVVAVEFQNFNPGPISLQSHETEQQQIAQDSHSSENAEENGFSFFPPILQSIFEAPQPRAAISDFTSDSIARPYQVPFHSSTSGCPVITLSRAFEHSTGF